MPDRKIKLLQHLLSIVSQPIKSYANLVITGNRMVLNSIHNKVRIATIYYVN